MGVLVETVAILGQNAFDNVHGLHAIKRRQLEGFFVNTESQIRLLSRHRKFQDVLAGCVKHSEQHGPVDRGGIAWLPGSMMAF